MENLSEMGKFLTKWDRAQKHGFKEVPTAWAKTRQRLERKGLMASSFKRYFLIQRRKIAGAFVANREYFPVSMFERERKRKQQVIQVFFSISPVLFFTGPLEFPFSICICKAQERFFSQLGCNARVGRANSRENFPVSLLFFFFVSAFIRALHLSFFLLSLQA